MQLQSYATTADEFRKQAVTYIRHEAAITRSQNNITASKRERDFNSRLADRFDLLAAALAECEIHAPKAAE